MTDTLINAASSFAGYQVETIDIDIPSGSGEKRKLIVGVFETDTIPTPTFNGVSPTNEIDSFNWVGEGTYYGKVFEWLDDDLPSSSGTYTLDANGERPYDLSILYGEGFNQANASNASNAQIDIESPESEETYSITGTSAGANYLLFSFHVGVDTWDSVTSIGAGQIPVWGSAADADIPPVDGDTGQQRLSSYSVNGGTTHSFIISEGTGSGAIHIHTHALDAVGGGGGGGAEPTGLVDKTEPYVMLDISSDTRTYDMTQPWRSAGKVGEYGKRIIWRRLGQHRSFTPRIRISHRIKRAIYAAYVEIEPCR